MTASGFSSSDLHMPALPLTPPPSLPLTPPTPSTTERHFPYLRLPPVKFQNSTYPISGESFPSLVKPQNWNPFMVKHPYLRSTYTIHIRFAQNSIFDFCLVMVADYPLANTLASV
ncbi:hypothetical protein L6452_36446 [Arctium lappa]|uniref:Uncharacterized protein n=1 Tax=Arctium lappa TaxID=4217 RepID=A0ACB8Y9U0_ARCLA|nr:hypothetical protein L6452_36446 [Arctium lappa]